MKELDDVLVQLAVSLREREREREREKERETYCHPLLSLSEQCPC